jgi:hypothetical protein
MRTNVWSQRKTLDTSFPSNAQPLDTSFPSNGRPLLPLITFSVLFLDLTLLCALKSWNHANVQVIKLNICTYLCSSVVSHVHKAPEQRLSVLISNLIRDDSAVPMLKKTLLTDDNHDCIHISGLYWECKFNKLQEWIDRELPEPELLMFLDESQVIFWFTLSLSLLPLPPNS